MAAGNVPVNECIIDDNEMIPLEVEQQMKVKQIIEAYLPPQHINEENENDVVLQVPDFQRQWSWNGKRGLVRMQKLIDSMIKNYPIPAIILNKVGRGLRSKFMIFDGRHRIETLWRFHENKFKINIGGRMFKFEELPQVIQERFLNRRITAIITDNADNSKLADIFIRLNNGKPLGDKDMFWAQKESYVVQLIKTITGENEYNDRFKEIFAFDFDTKDKKNLRSKFHNLCGLVIGLGTNDATKMSTSYAVNSNNLVITVDEREVYEVNVRTGLMLIFDLFQGAYNDFGASEISKTKKKGFMSLGKLIPFFYKEYVDEQNKEQVIAKWREIIVYILKHKDGKELLKTTGAQNLNEVKITKTLQRVSEWWRGDDVPGVIPRNAIPNEDPMPGEDDDDNEEDD